MAKKVDKPFASGTMSSAAFFGMIRNALRNRSRFWKPIQNVRNAARIPYKGDNKRRKWSYICANCKQEFDSKQINVHHIKDCGALNSFADLAGFCKRLFCEEKGLKVLCKQCHDKEHKP